MEQIAKKITEGFIQELPEQTNFFTPGDLHSSGIPGFVVKTLEKTVAGKIGANMNLPQSEWVQTDANKVQAAWLNFVDISKEHIKIPSAKLHDLLLNAVERCLKLSLQPRQSVPEFVFKTPDEIDLETLKTRVSNLYVNRPLGVAMLRYMEKKGFKELELEEARDIVKKIDQKLCENYHPLNWAQVLKPVFQLAGPLVDSDLFRIFFQDKDKSKIARRFDLLDKEISETEFIEIMSSAETLDVEGYEETQPHLFSQAVEEKREAPASSKEEDNSKAKPEDSPDEKEPISEKESAEETAEVKEEEEEEKVLESPSLHTQIEKAVEADQDDELETEEENIADLFTEIKRSREEDEDYFDDTDETASELSVVEPEEESDSDEENVTLLNKFMFDEGESDELDDEDDSDEFEDEEEREDEEESGEKREPASIYEEMNLVQESRNRAERMANPFVEDESEEEADEEEPESHEELSYKIIEREGEALEESEQEEIQPENDVEEAGEDEEKEGDKDELPMWRSFLERDDIETESGYEYDEDSEEEIEDDEGFIEEPIYDLTAAEEDPHEKIQDVSKWLEDEKDWFVEEIFRNSEMAYEQALIEIMDFNDWKSASHYLEREVFSRNKIDVYDEAAVDFTDRLHSYFMENKS